MIYYPYDVSIPPRVGEFVYYSRKIQSFSSDLFFCVRPRWICNIRGHSDKQFFVHFSSEQIIPDFYNCICIGKCSKIIEKLDLITLKKML